MPVNCALSTKIQDDWCPECYNSVSGQREIWKDTGTAKKEKLFPGLQKGHQ